MTGGAGLLKIETTPRGVLYKHEAISYLGGNEELFKSLCDDYGLRPVHRNQSRIIYRISAIEDSLREKELSENHAN